MRRFRLPSMTATEDTFARLVSLAVHDLRTPLATVAGFARTLQRNELGDPIDRYVEIMVAASDQLAELLDDVGLASRIEGGRWEPNVQEVDTLELAQSAADGLESVVVEGTGDTVRVDREAAERALHLLARCTLRHGGLERVTLTVDGREAAIAPVPPPVAPILSLESMRDLGAAVATRVVAELGGSIQLEPERLVVRFPG